MSAQLKLQILTPEKALPEQDVTKVNAPGLFGYVEILRNHAPYITELDVGILRVDDKAYFIAGGYLEVLNNEVKILADVLEQVEDIDAARAENARDRAIKRLEAKVLSGEESQDSDILDTERAQQALKRACTRLDFRVL